MCSRPGTAGTVALAPVAIRQRSNGTSRSPPVARATTSVWPSLKRASPRTTLMLGFDCRMSSYLAWRSSSTRACCWASRRGRCMTGAVALMAASPGLTWRRCAWAAERSALDERDLRTVFGGLERGRHVGAAAADDVNMQLGGLCAGRCPARGAGHPFDAWCDGVGHCLLPHFLMEDG